MELRNDFHIHTIYSNHAHPDMTVPNLLAAARAAGLREIVVLEHIPSIGPPQPVSGWYAGRNRRESLDCIAQELTESEPLFPSLKIWRGAEVDADPFQTDGALMLEDAGGLDLIVGSTHVLPDGVGFWFEPLALTPEQGWALAVRWRDWVVQIVRAGRIHVLAHPCDILCSCRLAPPFDSDETRALVEPLLGALAETGVAFELNELLGSKLLPPYRSTYAGLVRSARKAGVTFSIASDAHQPERVGHFVWVRELIEAARLTKDRMWQGPGASRR